MDRGLLEHVLEVSRHMAETRDLDTLLNDVMDEAIKLVGAERGYVILAQPDGTFDFCVQRGQDSQPLEDVQDQVSHSILRQVIDTGQPLVLRDAQHNGLFGQVESVVILGLRSVMCVPLVLQGNTIGAIYVENRSIRGRFSQDDVIPLVLFANQIAVDIENARLFQALQEANDELEMRVEERTTELRQEIVERKRVEEELRRAKEEAEAANRAKSVFLANVSHELRTPLNAILGFSALMSRDPNLTREQRENLATIGHSGEHLLALIDDVLELSKIEAGRVESEPESFDLHQMLHGLREMFSLRTQAKGLILVFDLAPGVPQHIRADQGKLRQVLINLLDNAVKFTQEGEIALRVKRIPNSEFRILSFEVEDTGVGIAPNELNRVFYTFVQTSSGQQSTKGTGLGMPISREFVRMMGGDLTVNSPPPSSIPPIERRVKGGPGTLFRFDIPVEIVDAAEVENVQSQRRVVGLEPGQPVYKLLIVEDVDVNRKLLVDILRSIGPLALPAVAGQGFELREAVNGREAIEVWEEWRPQLIWMDMRMPVMDGREASQYIKSILELIQRASEN